MGFGAVATFRTSGNVVFDAAVVESVTELTRRIEERLTQAEALALATDDDRLAFGERELYWLRSGGTRESALDQQALARLLGPSTMRTKGTIDQLAAKHLS